MARILNRTLIVPPILGHHAVALGSCPEFRVLSPARYESQFGIIQLSFLALTGTKSLLETLCSDELAEQSQAYESLKQCGYLLSGVRGNVDKCFYGVDEDCRTTVWTYENGDADGRLDSFQPDEKLKKKRKLSYVRRRRDVYKTLGHASLGFVTRTAGSTIADSVEMMRKYNACSS